MADIVDRQLVDTDGAQVIRCSDAFLAEIAGTWRLVAVDVSLTTLWHRLVTPRRPAIPRKVIDWSTIVTFIPGHQVHLDRVRSELPRLRAAELADLLEDLNGPRREGLLESLSPEVRADAVEEMGSEHVRDLLTSLSLPDATRLLEDMDPDEAVDALRDLPNNVREDVIEHMDDRHRDELTRLLTHVPGTAGSLMTPRFVALSSSATVADAKDGMRNYLQSNGPDLQFALIVDDSGRVINDITAVELAVASPETPVGSLLRQPGPITVTTDSDLAEVISALRDNRASWLTVVDEQHHPVGRIEADDVIDALTEIDSEKGLLWKKSA